MSFAEIVGASVVLRSKGKWRTAALYEYKGLLFAKEGSGFIRLNSNGSSSVDGVMVENLTIDNPLFEDKFGRLSVSQANGNKLLSDQQSNKLLIGQE